MGDRGSTTLPHTTPAPTGDGERTIEQKEVLMNSRTRLLLSIGIPVVLILVVVGTFLWYQHGTTPTSPAHGPQKLTTMTLALDWTPNTNHTGIYVALAKGWYRAEGIDLRLLPYSSSVSPEVLVSSGKADVGISATEGVVSDAAIGQPVVSIAAIIQHNTSALVTRVGGKGGSKSVALTVDAMQALESHRIDFVWVFEGWEVIQAQQRMGVKLNVFPITDYGVADYYTPTIITGPAEMKQKPDLLHRFMAATERGYEYARTHAQESAQILLQEAPKGTFPDPELVIDSQQFLSPRYADPGRKWGWQDAAAWHGYPQFMLDTGGIDDASGKPIHSLNFDSLYTNQFL